MPNKLYNIALDCVDKNAQSLHNKHKLALIYQAEGAAPLKLSFANLEGLTNRMANAFKGLKLAKGDRVVLRLANSPDFPIAFLGAIKAGLIPIPTSPLFTWEELKFILEDSQASALITSKELLTKEILEQNSTSVRELICLLPREDDSLNLFKQSKPRLSRFQDLLKNSPPQFSTEVTSENDPAFWLYTSGTEGKPKAVIHAHRSIPAHDARAKLWQDLRFNDVVFNTSALNWSYALTSGLLDLWRHGLPTLIYEGALTAEKICKVVKHFGVTTFMSVPGIYQRLVEYLGNPENGMPFSQVRVCNSAGEKLSEELRAQFKLLTGLEIYEGLGMTEHSVYLAQRVGEEIVPHSCGQALPQQNIAIVDESGRELANGTPGILASSRSCAGLMLGYHKRPHEEESCFAGDWFLSGDIAQQDEAGNFFFLGRRDDVITAGGYRISPLEVERVLNEMESVAESAVVGREDMKGKTFVKAFIVLKENISADPKQKEEILHKAKEKLAPYKCPKEIEFIESLAKTSNAKLQRKSLPR